MLSLFLNQHFSNTLMEKNMSCVKIQVKMLQFPSWTYYWKMEEQQKPWYVGPLEDTQYHQVDDFGKSISNPLVFSAPAQAPKGTLTNARDGEVFVLRPKHWSSNMMYVWSLVRYLPGVTKFAEWFKMHGLPSLNTTSFRGVHCLSCYWKKMPSWTFCVLSLCSCSLGHVGPSCYPHMFPMFHLIETSPVRQIQNCKMWMALGNESPTFKSLRGNKSTQLLYGQIILIHPIDQHLVKANRIFWKHGLFTHFNVNSLLLNLRSSLVDVWCLDWGDFCCKWWYVAIGMNECTAPSQKSTRNYNTTCMTWNSVVILNI